MINCFFMRLKKYSNMEAAQSCRIKENPRNYNDLIRRVPSSRVDFNRKFFHSTDWLIQMDKALEPLIYLDTEESESDVDCSCTMSENSSAFHSSRGVSTTTLVSM